MTVPEHLSHQSQDTMPVGRERERGGEDYYRWVRVNNQHTLLMNLLWNSSGLLSLCLWKLRATPASQPTPR